MSDFFSLYDNMLVWEYLDHFARCYGIPRARRQKLIDDLLGLFGGRARPIIAHLIDSGSFTREDIREAEKTLLDRERKEEER